MLRFGAKCTMTDRPEDISEQRPARTGQVDGTAVGSCVARLAGGRLGGRRSAVGEVRAAVGELDAAEANGRRRRGAAALTLRAKSAAAHLRSGASSSSSSSRGGTPFMIAA